MKDAAVSMPSSPKKPKVLPSLGFANDCCCCCCGIVANTSLKSMFAVSKANPAPSIACVYSCVGKGVVVELVSNYDGGSSGSPRMSVYDRK